MKSFNIIILIISLILISPSSYAQKKDTSRNFKDVKGDLLMDNSSKTVNTYHYNSYKIVSNENISKLLLLNKYIDINKQLKVKLGGGSISFWFKHVKNGLVLYSDDYSFIKLKAKGNQLLVDCTIFSIDGDYIAKIENNKLLPSKELEQYGSDRWIEVISKQNIPILQVALSKNDNSIEVGGLFFSESSYTIFSKSGMHIKSANKPYMLMKDEEKRAILYNALKEAKKYLTQLHIQ